MSERTLAIAAIPLARAPLRLLLAPLVLVLAGAVAAAGGVVVGGPIGAVLVAAGVVVAALALYLAAMLLSIRLDVEVATLRVHWLGGGRRYMLSRGAVTRVILHGEGAARLRPRFGALGWAFGRATLRGEERIEVIRLARAGSLILVPTDRGRLAVAPASEAQLIEALMAAARVQQRLDDATKARGIPLPTAPPPAAEVEAEAEPPAAAAEPPPSEPYPGPEPVGRLLTGIERTLLEERLAAERAAALAAAEAERRAAQEAVTMAAVAPVEPPTAPEPEAEERPHSRFALRLPALRRRSTEPQLSASVAEPAIEPVAEPTLATSVAEPAIETVAEPTSESAIEPVAWHGAEPATAAMEGRAPVARAERARVAGSLLLRTAGVSVPVLAAGVIAGVALVSGKLDLPEVQLRPAALALVLAGPLGGAAALIARTWFPRLTWLVAVSSLLALVLVGRALLA